MRRRQEEFGFRARLGFGVGDVANNLYWTTVSLFLLYFYTDVAGLSSAVAGLTIMVALIWDGLIDPFVGALANRTRTRWGRYRPYLLFGSLPLALSFVLLFLPVGLEGSALALFALASQMLFRTVFAFTGIPYSSLSASLTTDSQERNALTAVRMMFATGTGLLIAFFTQPIVAALGGGRDGFFGVAVIYATLAIIIHLLCFASTKEQVSGAGIEARPPTFRELLRTLRRNRAFLIVFGATVLGTIGGAIGSKVLLYFFKYNIERPDLTNVALALATGTVFVFVPVWSWVTKRTSKRLVWLIGAAISATAATLIFFSSGQGADVRLILALLVVQGSGTAAFYLTFWSMLPDTVEYGEFRGGVRTEGVIFGLVTFAQKAALGLGIGLLGVLLELIGYRANEQQTPATLADIRILFSLVPAAALILSAALIYWYPLDGRLHGRLVRVLSRRRSRATPTTVPPVS